jgi:SNF2 family DNA or RNA helicase
LLSITSSEELSSLLGDWQRQQALRQWEDGLDGLLEAMERHVVRPRVQVRLQIGKDAARLQILRDEEGEDGWATMTDRQFSDTVASCETGQIEVSEGARFLLGAIAPHSVSAYLPYGRSDARERLGRLILNPLLDEEMVMPSGEPVRRSPRRLLWKLKREAPEKSDYLLELAFEDGERPAEALFYAGGMVNCYVTQDAVYRTAPLLKLDPSEPMRIPAAGLLSGRAIQLLSGLGVALPEEVQEKVLRIEPTVHLQCRLEERSGEERICIRAFATVGDEGEQVYAETGWITQRDLPADESKIVVVEDSRLRLTPGVLRGIGVNRFRVQDEFWDRLIGKRFPEEFSSWLDEMPPGFVVDLEGDLASLRSAVISGSLKLEVLETSPDWFDLHVALSLSDTELTKDEIKLLLEAKGKFVRLKDKGWRKLEFELDDAQAEQLSELGINAVDFNGPPQRFHALQLAASSASALIEAQAREGIMRRAAELQTSVTPEVPAAIQAEMRGYQVEGYHFLSYLSTNRFGGILADDMGLGKTLQTLTWIAWLREQPDFQGKTVLVVCPKSVVQNWLSESARFLPGINAVVWRGGDIRNLKKVVESADLVVINYAQLRLSAEPLQSIVWGAVVLDEAQYIKNPSSQTATAACALRGAHRLALSGTPIENRLLDLWSIMHFAMPGLLGLRAHFNKQYDSRTDALARRRLATRIRPFILRRTKGEVAKDLPARIEEDLVVEMEGTQSQMYRAELKLARQTLLKLKTSRDLDKQRFNVLTSLLRLRQICCHPGLVSDEHGHADSAKMEALVDLLEPLIERGQKVLVFSQFVEMLSRVEREVDARNWTSFMLTGETEDRGELVDAFQNHDGPAVFLISLRAGGMGLNLTAASYVVLFDPWWNPAVENQAIDRTHRIGQTQQVIAYRLVAKGSVEEKIRQLQRTKSAMAGDILGEEAFGKALTLSDFQFLLEE